MKIDGAKDKVIFSTGLERYANNGIIGLAPDLDVSEGYDGGFFAPELAKSGFDPLTASEQIELAEYMIQQWERFRRRAVRSLPTGFDKLIKKK